MKKIAVVLLIAMFLATPCFAQAVRSSDATIRYEGKSNFGNLAVYGLDQEGNPGYIEMVAPYESGTAVKHISYFLYLKSDGDLCIASAADFAVYSSFPTGNWNNYDDACTVVGGQS